MTARRAFLVQLIAVALLLAAPALHARESWLRVEGADGGPVIVITAMISILR